MAHAFKSKLLAAGKSSTGVEVPEKIVEALGSKRPKVKATINGYTWRSSVASMGGKFMLGVSAEVREQAGVKAGDAVSVTLELDTEERTVEVPADFAKALSKVAAAKTFFDGLSYSNRRRLILAIEGAKAAETRARRIEKTVAALAEGKA